MKARSAIPVLWLGVVSHGFVALGQSSESFTPAGNMTAPRTKHTATLLFNGNVLIAGGLQLRPGGTVWPSAELFDPSTSTFAATGNLNTARSHHTATLLANGKVLIAGGASRSGSAMSSAELYDPATATFVVTSDMNQARHWHTATLLNSGKVLIAGGALTSYASLASAELYDPSTGVFTVVGNMTAPRFAHTATLLANGKVLLDGSQDDGVVPGHGELYDPGTETFVVTGGPPYMHFTKPEAAALLANGKVLVTRTLESEPLADLYDPLTGTYSEIGKLGDLFRTQHTATQLGDGTILIAGGSPGGESLLYDVAAGKFSLAANFLTFRRWHTATLLLDGAVLITGGYDTPPVTLKTAQLYHPAVMVPAPMLLSLAEGQGAILHTGSSQVATASNAAFVGEVLEIYCVGLVDGSVIPPQVTIGGRIADVLYFGKAPGFMNLNQVNVRVPRGVVPGSAVPVRLSYLGRTGNEVTIGVQ